LRLLLKHRIFGRLGIELGDEEPLSFYRLVLRNVSLVVTFDFAGRRIAVLLFDCTPVRFGQGSTAHELKQLLDAGILLDATPQSSFGEDVVLSVGVGDGADGSRSKHLPAETDGIKHGLKLLAADVGVASGGILSLSSGGRA
jgi:hypothetical protein